MEGRYTCRNPRSRCDGDEVGFEKNDLGMKRQKGCGKVEQPSRMVRPEGFEPPTYWFVARRSIQLSYGRTLHGSN